MLNFDRSTVKHTLQNTQNDSYQWLSHSFRVHQILFWPGLRPGPRWEAYSTPRPSKWFNAALLLRGRGGREEGGEKQEGGEMVGEWRGEKGKGEEGWKGTGPLFQKFLDPPQIQP